MRKSIYRGIGIVVALIVMLGMGMTEAAAQHHPERRLVREGNDDFARRNYRSSYNRYNEALEHDSTCYEALYNRANGYHHLRRSNTQDSTLTAEVGFRHFERIAADTLLTAQQRGEVLRNLGESLFSEAKYEAALNAFREALLLNPADDEVKHNYILTKRIVDQKRSQQQQQQQNDNQNQQNQDQQQNDNQDQQQDNQQQNDNQDQQDNQQQNDQEQNDGQEEQQNDGQEEQNDGQDESEAGARPEELSSDKQRMLDAIQAEEDKTQDKLKDAQRAVVIPGKKNW